MISIPIRKVENENEIVPHHEGRSYRFHVDTWPFSRLILNVGSGQLGAKMSSMDFKKIVSLLYNKV